MNRNSNLLRRAYDAWLAAENLRQRRIRQKRYTYGDQWSDIVDDHSGRMVVERDLILEKGKRPLTNNLIRQLVKAIVGRYRNIVAESGLYDTDPDSVDVRNQMLDLDCRMLEEFVISGCAIQRIVAERRPGGDGVWVDNVNPNEFFINAFRDPRGFDIDFIGMLHNMSLPEIINRFSGGSQRRAELLERLFNTTVADSLMNATNAIGAATIAGDDFFRPLAGKFRVIEVWQLEGRPAYTAGRLRMEMIWTCSWLAPDGTVIASYDSPFPHKSHPFVVKFYPLTDGEVHSFVEDVIDQQKTINRMVVLIDSMMATSAKGTLLFPIDQLVKGVSLNEVARCWAAPDSVIPITGRGPNKPEQVITRTADSGAYQLLNLQFKLFEEISGMNSAMLGRDISPAIGAELYQEQVRNAFTTLVDLIETFASFTTARTAKASTTM